MLGRLRLGASLRINFEDEIFFLRRVKCNIPNPYEIGLFWKIHNAYRSGKFLNS